MTSSRESPGSLAAPTRRNLVRAGIAAAGWLTGTRSGAAQSGKVPMLATAPIDLAGNWDGMIPDAAKRVVERMRQACLDGVALRSDRQPERLRVDERPSGPPAIWLHAEPRGLAWILVDVGPRDWSKLAYQFGHELGHVVANSWQADAVPAPPCQWLEEALVEAFSIHGLARLADGWSRDPPFPDDARFGTAIAVYRQEIVERYAGLARAQGHADDLAAWFRANRSEIEASRGLGAFAQAASLTFAADYERDPATLDALGALNRWPGRSSLPLEDYLRSWELSCAEIGASPLLPVGLRRLVGRA